MTVKDRVQDEAELVSVVGKTPAAVGLKVIDHVDTTARRWLATSPLGVIALGGTGTELGACLVGGKTGFASSDDSSRLVLPLSSLDEPELAREGMGFGSLFFSPGIGETLRVNGVVREVVGDCLHLSVAECYLHCAKALIRSSFWQGLGAQPDADAPLAASSFMLLATMHRDGSIDVSPKGDPAGSLFQQWDGSIWFADRPGNRRMDGIKNILTQPRAVVLALYPGQSCYSTISGAAVVSADTDRCRAFAVDDRVPKLVLGVEQPNLAIAHSAALERAAIWDEPVVAGDIEPAAIFAAHVRLNKTKGLGAAAVRAMSSPTLMKQGLKHDYKTKLY